MEISDLFYLTITVGSASPFWSVAGSHSSVTEQRAGKRWVPHLPTLTRGDKAVPILHAHVASMVIAWLHPPTPARGPQSVGTLQVQRHKEALMGGVLLDL